MGKYDKYLLKQSTDNSRVMFDLYLSKHELSKLLKKLPGDGEVYKMISPAGGWSSCSLVMWIASLTKINDLFITTLRVGKKELNALVMLKKKGAIDNIRIMLGMLAKDEGHVHGKDYGYSENLETVCENNDIEYRYVKNHSKVILLDTESGKFVIETSSNFNENPKIEQFSLENSSELHDWYLRILDELLRG